jgi:hypothetical protein
MGRTPGDYYCDMCGAVADNFQQLTQLSHDGPGGGSAEICHRCERRPIADLLALMANPSSRATPTSRRASRRGPSMQQRWQRTIERARSF